jgi:branched-chain amino acid transport system ATP-binding protein
MLRLDNVSVRIGGVDILRDVSMHVPPNTFVALVGRNGAGKTSLMRAIMNLLPVAEGAIHIDNKDTTFLQAYVHARSGVGYMPEDRRLVAEWTVEQNIMLPAWAAKRADHSERLEQIYELIPEVRKFSDRKALQLSGGQQKLVALARAFMASHNLLLLDEPFEGVAPALVQRLIEILSRLRREGSLSVLVSESDAVYSGELVDRIYTIERGRVAPTVTSGAAA